ncbi:ATP-grasp fold amidoligase family protein [Ornithinimicrobium sp. Y1847]|uniref:ATP-grasp fold amidoligase family protein n=1 Tax=Ornithinimicrobium sp. Y1847 TaxID=3405419 RepID=UPI003B67DA3A
MRALPPVARRDQRIDRLGQEIEDLRSQIEAQQDRLGKQEGQIARLDQDVQHFGDDSRVEDLLQQRARRPSFLSQYSAYQREVLAGWAAGAEGGDVRVGMNRKLAMYRLAESHGVRVPRISHAFASLAAIEWDDLPERFVLKSDAGSASNGVFLLERDGDGFRLIGGGRRVSRDQVMDKLRSRHEIGRVLPPFFVEEVLDTGECDRLPVDIKIHAFYGEVGHVLLRDMARHGHRGSAKWRYLDRAGQDLGAVSKTNPVDPKVPVPARLPELVAIAEQLSRAMPLPFIRVDLYDLPESIVFGELTLMPGGGQRYTAKHDEFLGRKFEHAATRLAQALRSDQPYGLVVGEHPVHTPKAEVMLGTGT